MKWGEFWRREVLSECYNFGSNIAAEERFLAEWQDKESFLQHIVLPEGLKKQADVPFFLSKVQYIEFPASLPLPLFGGGHKEHFGKKNNFF